MNELVDWKTEMENQAKAAAALERPAVGSISLKSGIMAYQGVPVPGNNLDVVVTAYAFERAFYSKPYDPNVIASPDCFSLSLTGQDMIPDSKSADVQAQTCQECPKSKWAPNPKRPGKDHKECKEKRRLVLIPASALSAGEVAKAEMATLSVPVTSVKNWANYVNLCASAYTRPPYGMLTNILVKPHMQNQFEVVFAAKGVVVDEFMPEVVKKIASAQTLALTSYEAQPEAPAQVAPVKDSKKKY